MSLPSALLQLYFADFEHVCSTGVDVTGPEIIFFLPSVRLTCKNHVYVGHPKILPVITKVTYNNTGVQTSQLMLLDTYKINIVVALNNVRSGVDKSIFCQYVAVHQICTMCTCIVLHINKKYTYCIVFL